MHYQCNLLMKLNNSESFNFYGRVVSNLISVSCQPHRLTSEQMLETRRKCTKLTTYIWTNMNDLAERKKKHQVMNFTRLLRHQKGSECFWNFMPAGAVVRHEWKAWYFFHRLSMMVTPYLKSINSTSKTSVALGGIVSKWRKKANCCGTVCIRHFKCLWS